MSEEIKKLEEELTKIYLGNIDWSKYRSKEFAFWDVMHKFNFKHILGASSEFDAGGAIYAKRINGEIWYVSYWYNRRAERGAFQMIFPQKFDGDIYSFRSLEEELVRIKGKKEEEYLRRITIEELINWLLDGEPKHKCEPRNILLGKKDITGKYWVLLDWCWYCGKVHRIEVEEVKDP